ncbi:MAG TPA: hypothetical protein VIH48_02745 [Candidatus Bathyarchaeia archaeon]
MAKNVEANTEKTSNSGAVENPRLDDVEKEVQKLKVDVESAIGLKNTVEDLKNTIADVRTLISEAQNPSNLLQLITSDDDLNNAAQTKQLIERRLPANHVEKNVAAKGTQVDTALAAQAAKATIPSGFAVESTAEAKGTTQMEKTAACETEKVEKAVAFSETSTLELPFEDEIRSRSRHANADGANLDNATSVIHWIYAMLDLGFDAKSIQKICDYCEYTGFMPRGYAFQVSNVVGAIVKARSRNLSPEEVVLSMHAVADAVGVKKNSADLRGLVINVLKKSKADKCSSKCERSRS